MLFEMITLLTMLQELQPSFFPYSASSRRAWSRSSRRYSSP